MLPPVTLKVDADVDTAKAKLKGFKDELDKTAGVTGKYGHQTRIASMHTANLTAQMNDIGVMLASGQSPFILAMQQGTQVNQVLGHMGTTGKQRLQAVSAALKAAVSPANLMTVAIIAGGAALGQWALSAMSAGEEADELAKKLEKVREKSAEMQQELRAIRLGVTTDELTLLDNIALQEREVAKLTEERLRGNQRNLESVERRLAKESEVLAELYKELDALRRMAQEKATLTKETIALADAERQVWQTAEEVSREAERLTSEIGTAATKALILAGVDITSPIDSATKAAAELAAQLGIALGNAQAIQGYLNNYSSADEGLLAAQGNNLPGGAGGPGGLPGNRFNGVPIPKADIVNEDMFKTPKSRGGGGGGSKKENPLIADLEALREALATEQELIQETFDERLELLQNLYDSQLIQQEEFQDLSKRSKIEYLKEMADLDRGYHGSALDQAGAFFGDMASAFQSGNDKMLKIAKVFGAAEALINSLRAYNQVLADPTLPWFAKIPAALSVLTAGLGVVSSIRGVTSGGGGGGAAAGGAAAGATPRSSQTVVIDLPGASQEQADQYQKFANTFNEVARLGLIPNVTVRRS